VYVNDPVVDWLKAPLAKEVLNIYTYILTSIHLFVYILDLYSLICLFVFQDLMQLSDNVSWEPRRRVNIAIAKLMGNLDGILFFC
jgi:hypothetical protein